MENKESKYSEIKKVVCFAIAIGEASAQAANVAGGLRRALPFIEAADDALALLTVDRAVLKVQWDAMDDDAWDELVAECRDEFDLVDDDLEGRIERSFDHGFSILRRFEALAAEWRTA